MQNTDTHSITTSTKERHSKPQKYFPAAICNTITSLREKMGWGTKPCESSGLSFHTQNSFAFSRHSIALHSHNNKKKIKPHRMHKSMDATSSSSSSSAPDPQIGPIVQEWRSLMAVVVEKNKEVQLIRDHMSRLQQERSTIASEWEDQKITTEHTIDAVIQHIGDKRQELARMEKETIALLAKVQDRRKKIDDDTSIIRAREDTVDKKLKDALEKETIAKNKLNDFRDAREVARAKLLRSIEKLESSIPADNEAHNQQMAALRKKTQETEGKIETEALQWEALCLQREVENKTQCQKALMVEAQEASEAKASWSEALNVLSGQHGRCSTIVQEIAQLRQSIRPQ